MANDKLIAKPNILNGNNSSQINGYRKRAKIANGQQITKSIHQSKNFIMTLNCFIDHDSIDVPKALKAIHSKFGRFHY